LSGGPRVLHQKAGRASLEAIMVGFGMTMVLAYHLYNNVSMLNGFFAEAFIGALVPKNENPHKKQENHAAFFMRFSDDSRYWA
jgi:hypothetical protein